MKPTPITALAIAALAATATLAAAQGYPTKPITFIATEVVGSATDIQARIIAKGMARDLGQPIEIENIFGDAGVLKGIKAPPDGYTIVYGGAGTLALLRQAGCAITIATMTAGDCGSAELRPALAMSSPATARTE